MTWTPIFPFEYHGIFRCHSTISGFVDMESMRKSRNRFGRPGKWRRVVVQVRTEREEKNSIAIASNEPFSGWAKTFTDPRLRAAIVDRLTFNAHIIETGTTSYRLAHSRARRQS